MSGGRGHLRASFEVRQGRTELVDLRCQPPLQALRALRDGDTAELVVATLGPGLMGGDEARLCTRAGCGTRVRMTTTSATRVLPARGGQGAQSLIHLEVGQGAFLEYLPKPTIPQAGSVFRQLTRLVLDPGSAALIGDVMVPGRLASGELFAFDSYDAALEVRTASGDLLVAERQRIVPAELDPRQVGLLAEPNVVLASLFVLAPGVDLAALAEAIASELPATGGVTVLPNQAGLLVRALLPTAQAAERMLAAASHQTRSTVMASILRAAVPARGRQASP